MDTITPEPMAKKAFTDPVAAWAYLSDIYRRNTGFIRDQLISLTRAMCQGPRPRFLSGGAGHLEELRQDRLYPALRYLHTPGLYRTTVTAPELFKSYLIEQFTVILANHGGAIEVGESTTRIPLHFAIPTTERIDGEAINALPIPLRDLFDVPDLQDTDDEIANGTFVPPPGGPYPLAHFTAPRVDYSLQRLAHYTGTEPDHFQNFVIFTNYAFYMDEFARTAQRYMEEGHPEYESFVEPGGFVTHNSRLGGSTSGTRTTRIPQMPALHLTMPRNRGITIVNIGVGPSNAKTATDHIAVLRPHAWIMLPMRRSIRSSTSVVKVRTVPSMTQVSGTTLVASPVWIIVTEITPVSMGRLLRLMMVWKACTIWQAAGTGSTPRCGIAACEPLPRSVILNSLLEAKHGPARTAKCPWGRPGQLWKPKMASTGKRSNRPSLIISRAPPPPSSAGWKTSTTLPSKCRCWARWCAAASKVAVCPSCPQACILPACRLACANAFFSWMGKASMSARKATARADVPWRITPTTPVPPSPRCTSIPHSPRRAATRSAVRCSSKQSSGWACKSRRIAAWVSAWVSRESRTRMNRGPKNVRSILPPGRWACVDCGFRCLPRAPWS